MNAAYWLNSMKPQIMKTDQNIISTIILFNRIIMTC